MKSIILIGPMRAGKSTIASMLTNRLKMPTIKLDGIKMDYYPAMGYDSNHANQLYDAGGFEKKLTYLKPFEAALVERILQDYPADHVIDFGAGHSVYQEEDLFARVAAALSPFPKVIFLTPCADAEDAIRILQQRDLEDGESGLPAINRLFVTHPSNAALATHTVYNKNKSPKQTCDEIMQIIRL